jgi:hypothetical protein
MQLIISTTGFGLVLPMGLMAFIIVWFLRLNYLKCDRRPVIWVDESATAAWDGKAEGDRHIIRKIRFKYLNR